MLYVQNSVSSDKEVFNQVLFDLRTLQMLIWDSFTLFLVQDTGSH